MLLLRVLLVASGVLFALPAEADHWPYVKSGEHVYLYYDPSSARYHAAKDLVVIEVHPRGMGTYWVALSCNRNAAWPQYQGMQGWTEETTLNDPGKESNWLKLRDMFCAKKESLRLWQVK